MFQRKLFKLLVLLTSICSCYYLYDIFKTDQVPEKFQITWERPLTILYFGLGCVMYVSITVSFIVGIYDYLKKKREEKKLTIKRQLLLLDQLERGKQLGATSTDPYIMSIEQFMINEGLGLSTKGTKLKDLHKQISSPIPKRKVTPPPPYTEKMSTTIINKLTPKSLRRGPKTNDRFDKNDDLNNSNTHRSYNTPKPERKTVDVHTPQARRKLLDKQVPKQSTSESVVDGVPVRSVKEIIAELHTPKSIKREYTGRYNNRV